MAAREPRIQPPERVCRPLFCPLPVISFFWAHRLAILGVAPEPLSGKRFNSAQLQAALAFAQQDSVRARAQQIARDMAQEDGVAVAVEAIEALMR